MSIAAARSLLFVPATRPERFAKALASGADAVVLDLEDAVPAEQKDAARATLVAQCAALASEDLARVLVRINAAGTSWHEADLAALVAPCAQGLGGVMVAKAESAAGLAAVAARLGPRAALVALVESLAGLDAVDYIAQAPQVLRLAFGHLDFQLDLGMRCQPAELELVFARFQIVAASRRAALAAPLDGVTTDTTNSERLQADAERARAFGFGGKLCIHPSQVARVNAAFTPSAAEIDWSRRVVEQSRARAGATFSLDGRMVDLPVLRAAEAVLRQARR